MHASRFLTPNKEVQRRLQGEIGEKTLQGKTEFITPLSATFLDT